MDEIKQETIINKGSTDFQGTQIHQNQLYEDERTYISNIPQSTEQRQSKNSSFTARIKRGAGILLFASLLSVVAMEMTHTSKSVDTSAMAKEAIETHISTTLAIGTRILSNDDNYIGGDLTITHHSDEDETTIWVWDYAAEDGDYVQIIVDGTPLGEPFMIKNKPVSFKVPTVAEVQVLGTRDGGGGITYGVYYELNQTTYFNGVNQGGNNLYTLIKE